MTTEPPRDDNQEDPERTETPKSEVLVLVSLGGHVFPGLKVVEDLRKPKKKRKGKKKP